MPASRSPRCRRPDCYLLLRKKENQIGAAALRAAEERLLRVRPLLDIRLQPEPVQERVLDDEVGRAAVADRLSRLDVQVRSDLLSDRERRRTSVAWRHFDFERVELEGV